MSPQWFDVEGDPDLVKHKNGTYYVRASALGPAAKGPRSTGETEFRAAVAAKRELIKEFAKLDPTYVPRKYSEVADKVWDVKQAGSENRASTRDQAKPLYEKLKAYARKYAERYREDDLTMDQADDAWWLWLVEQIKAEPVQGVDEMGRKWKKLRRKTFANLRKYAKQIDNYAFSKRWKESKSEFPIKDPKPREGKVLSDDQFRRLMEKASFRMQAILVCARYMGMRRSEIIKLHWVNVNFQTMSIKLEPHQTKTGSKTGRGREFAIAPEALPFLLALKAEATTPWVFPNMPRKRGMGLLPPTGPLTTIRKPVNRLRELTGVQFRLHDLRHTFLTIKLLVEKLPPMDVAIYAGVSLKVIEDVYLHPKVDDTRYVVARPLGAPGWDWGAHARLAGVGDEVLSQARLLSVGLARDVTPAAPLTPQLPPPPAGYPEGETQ